MTNASARKQFGDRFGATAADYQNVLDWAQSKNLAVVPHPNRLVATATGTVGDIESAFHVRMQYGLRPDGSRFYAPDAEPSVEVGVPLAHVSDLEDYVLPRPAGDAGGSGPGGNLTGADFRNAYASCTTLLGEGQTIGIFNPDTTNGYAQADVDYYFKNTSIGGVYPTPPTVIVDPRGPAITDQGWEGELDVQVALSMAPAAQIVVFTGSTNKILSDMSDYFVPWTKVIQQLSSSWTANIDSTGAALIAEFALQGQSFFSDSGDWGGSAPSSASGFNELHTQPWVTTVGGTVLTMTPGPSGNPSYSGEVAWLGSSGTFLSFATGGGAPIPAYQLGAATAGIAEGNLGSRPIGTCPTSPR
jgi:subtilase family serine protease